MHGHDINLDIFFRYLRKTDIPVIWTLHDCWPFTGYCMHFDAVECKKWQTECKDCPQRKKFSFFFDNSQKLFMKKKELFTSLSNLTIVSPSVWLGNLASQSFLNKYPIKVINNGIDLDVFKKTDSDFKKRYGIDDKRMILGIPKERLNRLLSLQNI